jgi:hypothetical protein
MYLLEEPKRQKVLRALGEALHLVESGKLSASQTTASRKARADFKAFDKLMGAAEASGRAWAMSRHRALKVNKKAE